VQASGTLGSGGGNEIWTMGVKVVNTAAGSPTVAEIPTQADVADAAEAGLAAFQGLISSSAGAGGALGGLVSDYVLLKEVKAYAVGPDNHADITRQTEYRFGVAGDHGIAAPNASDPMGGRLPYSVSVVITFRGALYRKQLAAFGRIYIPGANIFATSIANSPHPLVDGLMDPDTVAGFAAAGAAFIHTVNNHVITGALIKRVANVAVVKDLQSRVRWQPVTEVDVDSRPDTVRRRQNKISGRGKVTIQV
jgi:hypothetical protein